MKNRSAKTMVPKGTNILKSLPFAYVIKSSMIGERCDGCFTRYIISISTKKTVSIHRKKILAPKRVSLLN